MHKYVFLEAKALKIEKLLKVRKTSKQ